MSDCLFGVSQVNYPDSDPERTNDVNKTTLLDVIWCRFESTSGKQTERRFYFSFTIKIYQQKGDFIRFVCVRIAVALG